VNSLDNQVALLLPGSDGPQLAAVLTPPNLSVLSDVALGSVDGHTLTVYVTAEGQDTATRLSFNLDPSPGVATATPQTASASQTNASALPSEVIPGASSETGASSAAAADQALLAGLVTLAPAGEALLPSPPGQQVTEFSTLPDQHLGVVVTLLLGAGEDPGARPSGPAAGEGAILGSSPAAVTLAGYDGGAWTDEAGWPNGPAPSASALLGLNAFITGSADALPERLLTGPVRDSGQPPGVPVPVPELFDFSAVPPVSERQQGAENVSGLVAPQAGAGEAAREAGAVPSYPERLDGDSEAREQGRREPDSMPSPVGETPEVADKASPRRADSAWARGMALFLAQSFLGIAAGTPAAPPLPRGQLPDRRRRPLTGNAQPPSAGAAEMENPS
jgi:hypothetical protein